MLEALYERGITPDFLVGTSVGALNAAFVASRPQSPQTARELGRVWRSLQREDVFPVSMSALVGGVCGRRDHLVPDRELRRLIRRHIEFGDLADATIPLHLVAFDLLEGRELRLSTGSAVDAIAASASIPGIFPPVAIGEQRLNRWRRGQQHADLPRRRARRRAHLRPADAGASQSTRPRPDRRARRGHPGAASARGLPTRGRHRQILDRGGADLAPGPERGVCTADELRALPPPNRRRARSDPDGAPAITAPRTPATGELRATWRIGASHAAPLADVFPWLSIDRCEPDAGQRANDGTLKLERRLRRWRMTCSPRLRRTLTP